MKIEALIDQIEPAELKQFLTELLNSSSATQKLFLERFQDRIEPGAGEELPGLKDSINTVLEISEAVSSDLNGIDMEDIDYESYYDGTYKKHWEIGREHFETECNFILEPYIDEIENELLGGYMLKAVQVLSGVFLGCLNSEIDDPNCDIHDEGPDQEFITAINTRFYNRETVTRNIAIKDANASLELSLEVFREHISEENRRDYLRLMERFLVHCIYEQESATSFLTTALSIPGFDQIAINLVGKALKISGENARMVEYYEKNFDQSLQIGIGMVRYLLSIQDLSRASLYANRLITTYKNAASDFVIKSFEAGSQPFIEALKAKVKSEKDLQIYKILSVYLNEEEINAVVGSLYDKTFAAKILAFHEKYDDIVKMLDEMSESYEFIDIATLLASPRPESCFECIRSHTLKYYENTGSSNHYRRLAELLKLSLTLDIDKPQVIRLIAHFYHSTPVRPALRRTFKEVGIVRD